MHLRERPGSKIGAIRGEGRDWESREAAVSVEGLR